MPSLGQLVDCCCFPYTILGRRRVVFRDRMHVFTCTHIFTHTHAHFVYAYIHTCICMCICSNQVFVSCAFFFSVDGCRLAAKSYGCRLAAKSWVCRLPVVVVPTSSESRGIRFPEDVGCLLPSSSDQDKKLSCLSSSSFIFVHRAYVAFMFFEYAFRFFLVLRVCIY